MKLVLDRRSFIATTAAASALGGGARARTPGGSSLVIYDPAAAPAAAFAAHAKTRGARALGVSGDLDIRAAARRGFDLASGERVVGLTRWADWTALRGALAETGRRPRFELRVDCTDAAGEHPWPRALAAVMACDPREMAALHGGRVNHVSPGHAGTLFAWVMG